MFAHKYSSHYKLREYLQVKWVPHPTIILARVNAYSCASVTLRLSGTVSDLLFILEDLSLLFAWLMKFCTREFPFHSPDIFNFLLSLDHIHCHYQFLPCLLIVIVSLSSLTLLFSGTIFLSTSYSCQIDLHCRSVLCHFLSWQLWLYYIFL